MTGFAEAQPEKRLFISLLTRDISLVDAVLDLIDNSINSAIILSKRELDEPGDYIALLRDEADIENLPMIDIRLSEERFSISDTCGGISYKMAEEHVFRFGRGGDGEADDEADDTAHDELRGDRLSVYGIGLKRAIFKIGDKIEIFSAHPEDGFSMDLTVSAWGRLKQQQWRIPIERTQGKMQGSYGTNISITSLYPDIRRRISGGAVASELIKRIGRTYNYFLDRVVKISVNGSAVPPIDLAFGDNTASKVFALDGVSCAVMAGISVPKGRFHTADVAGWYVFCNGRAVAFADKTAVTGWGVQLPNFQPKHRPFIGLVFFTAEDPELLPWTTTKSAINQESAIWQHALTIMSAVGRQITGYLDSRYSDDGTEITLDELSDVAGKPASAFSAVATSDRTFSYKKAPRTDTSIQFRVKISEVDEVRGYLGRRSMSNGEVGRTTFDYYLENVVRE